MKAKGGNEKRGAFGRSKNSIVVAIVGAAASLGGAAIARWPASVDAKPLPIKGNIAPNGKRTYHLPGCPDYARTRIEQDHAERLFATEAEAIAAGWVKANNCQ
ncbi:MAG TPA: hypothetical protein VMG12_33945 [Polyangiaceae bacterium]|nr:hypothetical protein [Polyangiaceae bacterium]